MIKKSIQKLRKHTFVMQVATLMSGTALSQGVLFAATPFLTRLYSPEEFGVFALYLAIISPISMVSAWRYEAAIMLPKDQKDAEALLWLSLIITISMSLLVLLLIIIFEDYIRLNLTNDLDTFLWIVPLGVFLTGLFQVLSTWNTRNELYKNIAVSTVTRSASAVSVQIGTKTIFPFSGGLIWGNVIGAILASGLLLRKAITDNTLRLDNFSYDVMKKNAKEYDKFPKYQAPASFLNTLSQQVPVVLLAFFYSPEIAGYYALTDRVLTAPIALIGGSIRNVFYQKAAKLFSLGKSIKELYFKTTLYMLKLAVIPFSVIAFFAEPIFTTLFGDTWIISATIYQILFIYVVIVFINPPATTTIYILGLQRFSLLFTILITILRISSIYLGYAIFNDYYISLALYALVGICSNLYVIFFIFNQIKQKEQTRSK